MTSPAVIVRFSGYDGRYISLELLVALVPGNLGQFLRLGFQQFVEVFLYTPRTSSLHWPLSAHQVVSRIRPVDKVPIWKNSAIFYPARLL